MGEEGLVGNINWESREIVVHTHVGSKLNTQLSEAESNHEVAGFLNLPWRVVGRLQDIEEYEKHKEKNKDESPVWYRLKGR